MRLQVTQDKPSIEAARATAAAGERAIFDGFFERLATEAKPGDDASGDERWHRASRAEKEALRRGREEAVTRLLSIAEERGGEDDWTRLGAAVALGEVNRGLGLRWILTLLESDDPHVVAEILAELPYNEWVAGEDDGPGSLALAEADAGRLYELLGHHDSYVRWGAYDTLTKLKPPGMVDRFLGLIDDPIIGRHVRLTIAKEARPVEILDHAIDSLDAPTAGELNHAYLFIIGEFARNSPDARVSTRAMEALRSLRNSPNSIPENQNLVQSMLAELEKRDVAQAARAADFARATAAIERIAAAEFISATEKEAALEKLRGWEANGNWSKDPAWGAQAAFEAARLWLSFNQEIHDYPPAHDELIRDLAAASRGAFAPEGIFQVRDKNMGDYPVQFVHRDRLYRVMVSSRGARYDTDIIVAAANAAMKDAGDSRRFVRLRAGKEMAELVFAEPGRLRAIAEAIGLDPRAIEGQAAADADALMDPSSRRFRSDLRGLLPDAVPDLSDADYARARDDRAGTALHRAAEQGRPDLIEALIAADAEIEAVDEFGYTALHRAAAAGASSSIEVLIAAGADVDARDGDGWSPLHLAASRNQAGAIETLVRRGAVLRSQDDRGLTPLHTAANSGALAATALLIDRGIHVDVRIRRTTHHGKRVPVKVSLTRLLALAGWHIGGRVEEGQTPLHRAAHQGRSKIAEHLLERGADVDAVDSRLQTPLHLATGQGRTDLAEILIARGANPELLDDRGRRPAERAGDREAEDRKMRHNMRRLVWLIRAVQVVSFPFRLAGRTRKAMTDASTWARRFSD